MSGGTRGDRQKNAQVQRITLNGIDRERGEETRERERMRRRWMKFRGRQEQWIKWVECY